ncbi:MAG TPA: HEAT repeat domain-containing protein [Tepidisphaeraceae bacterium]|jgi:HEAT repeat protein|nr:HEAT repeat domain-containing protein [Tepidisphaeraceae bacterium]
MARKEKKESKKRHTAVPAKPKAAAKATKPKTTAEAVTPEAVEAAQVETIAQPAATAEMSIDREAMMAHIGNLHRADADIAREAAVSLADYRDAEAVDALMAVVANSDGYYHGVVRSAAAASLAKLGDVRAVDALLSAVRDPMAEASAEAVRALAELGDPRAIEPLVNVIRNVEGYFLPVVRLAAVHALAKFKTPEATAELANVASDEFEDTVIRNAAANAA